MKTNRVLLAAAAVFLSTLNPQLSTCFAQGTLTPPPGAPAPTMRSLDQIEPRTPISSAPYSINSSGSYYLTKNLTVNSGTAITIAADGVTLDLNGFTISSTASSPAASAIDINGGVRHDITISNGHIVSGVTNSGGTFSGTGFATGIGYYSFQNVTPHNVLVSHVTVAGVLIDGITLNLGQSTVVEACTVETAGNNGIVASVVRDSFAFDCALHGIFGYEVENCQGYSSGNGLAVSGNAVSNSQGQSGGGYGLSATTATNCVGFSTGGIALNANNAINCRGTSTSNIGVNVFYSAENCRGDSTSNTGLKAELATSSEGVSNTGTGMDLTRLAIGCYGQTTSGIYGLYIIGVASYSSGANSTSGGGGVAIHCSAAIGCSTFGGIIDCPANLKFLGSP